MIHRQESGRLFVHHACVASLYVDALGELDKLAGTFLGTRKAFGQIADAHHYRGSWFHPFLPLL